MRFALGGSLVVVDGWDGLVEACAEGVFDENEHCELKANLPPKDMNKEIACDLASLTVLGGALLVGVRDAGGGRAGAVNGVANPEAVATRLTQIAMGLVEPAVVCATTIISRPDGSGTGCVVVAVAPSSTAPHRAHERYWGRSSEGKRVLSDPEVAMLFERRRQRAAGLRDDLQKRAAADDLLEGRRRETGHLHFVSRLVHATGVGRVPWAHRHPLELIQAAAAQPTMFGGLTLASFHESAPHPIGMLAVSSYRDDTHNPEQWVGRLLIRDDGGLDLSVGGVAYHETRNTIEGYFAHLPQATLLIDHAVRLAAHLGSELGYAGTYEFGVRIDRLRGAQSVSAGRGMSMRRFPGFPEEDYEAETAAGTAEVVDEPSTAVSRLLAGFARGLGEGHRFPYERLDDLFAT